MLRYTLYMMMIWSNGFTKNPVINGFQSGSEYDDYESAFEDGLREAIKLIKK